MGNLVWQPGDVEGDYFEVMGLYGRVHMRLRKAVERAGRAKRSGSADIKARNCRAALAYYAAGAADFQHFALISRPLLRPTRMGLGQQLTRHLEAKDRRDDVRATVAKGSALLQQADEAVQACYNESMPGQQVGVDPQVVYHTLQTAPRERRGRSLLEF